MNPQSDRIMFPAVFLSSYYSYLLQRSWDGEQTPYKFNRGMNIDSIGDSAHFMYFG